MTARDHSAHAEQYRRERAPCSRELRAELTRISEDIADPVAKLRYLRGALEEGSAEDGRVARLPYGPARRALYRLRGLEALDVVIDPKAGDAVAVADRTLSARRRARRVVAGAVATGLLLVPALLAGVALQIDPKSSPVAATAKRSVATETAAVVAPPPSAAPTVNPVQPVAETLPGDVLGVMPTTIWLADRGPDWELYSNGLRIETSHTIAGEPRRYRVHHRDGGLQPTVHTKPVGIVFHTSESDLWPLEADFERQLRRTSSALLRYVQGAHAYHYLIDRFGRVYRVVDDDSRANHAGHSVWARNEEVYLDLNSAFLGVSFETRWEGGRTLPITRAQLTAGRNLTNYLRQRFAIAPEMCVTHGLTSVSPRTRLIGYHRDWARGFPFDAFGLPDLYAQPLPSVALFGFGIDGEFLNAIGERWPGLAAAERMLEQEAAARSLPLAMVRAERQMKYRKWSKQTPSGGSVARESTEGAAAAKSQPSADERG